MIALHLLIIVISCFGIWKVSDYFEEATEYLGRNMSNGVKGASLNAIGSSMPELVTSFIFLFFLTGSEGYAGTIGTTAGSAVFNTLLIPAAVIFVVFAAGVIKKGGIKLDSKVIRRDGIFLILSEFALILVISTNTITLLDGGILILLYLVYSIVLLRSSKGTSARIEGTPSLTRSSIIMLILSVIGMTAICWALVYSVEQIGILLDVPLIFVSVLLASAASSVPDTIISIRDGLKGNYDDAVSNALGSNIFDICIAHGLPLFIYIAIYGPITMSEETTLYSMELRIALIIVTIIATIIYFVKVQFKKAQAYQLVALYIAFIVYAVLRAKGI